MQETNVDLIALGPGAHMHWLLGFHPHPDERVCLLLIGAKDEAFLMPSLNGEGSRQQTDIEFFNWSDAEGPGAALVLALKAMGAQKAKSVVVDETMRADFALLLLDKLADATHRFTHDTLGALRMAKDEDEYKCLKENALINDRAMKTGLAALRAGISEADLATIIKEHFLSEGASLKFAIVGGGPNGAFPHHQSGERIFKEGDAVVIDIGGQKGDFPSDMTRMAVIGQPPEGYDEVHAIVEAALKAAMMAARPGVRALEVDKAARDVITKAGYGQYFVHRTGHGIGLEVHEPPFITSTSQTVLDTGMVFSIEPGIYLPGRFGVRLEDIVILRKDGPEILSAMPRNVHVATEQ